MERLQFFYISDKKFHLQNFPPLFSFTNLIPRSRNFLTKTSIFFNSFLSRTYIFLPLSKISFFFFFRQKKVLLFLLFLAPNIMDLSITTFCFRLRSLVTMNNLGIICTVLLILGIATSSISAMFIGP